VRPRSSVGSVRDGPSTSTSSIRPILASLFRRAMRCTVSTRQRIARRNNEARIGRIEEVLVEGPSRTEPTLLRGRTRRNTTVNFAGDAAPGELVDVAIDGATSTTLRGAQRTLVAA